jgi:hypothetical protein
VEKKTPKPKLFHHEREKSILKSEKSHVGRSWKAKRAISEKLRKHVAIGHWTIEDLEKKDFWGSGNTWIIRCYRTVEY